MWHPSIQRTIRAISLLLATLAVVVGAGWLLYFSEYGLNSTALKNVYTTLQIRGEFLNARDWTLIIVALLILSFIGVPSGLQLMMLFSFLPPAKTWALIILTQTLSTLIIAILGRFTNKIGGSLPPELISAVAEAGDPLKLAWFLRMFLGIPNRTIDLALTTQISPTITPVKLALWSLPGHAIRAALTGFWIYSISLVILDFRPFPKNDLLTATVATAILSCFWLLPWIPELIPGEDKLRRIITICALYTSREDQSEFSSRQNSYTNQISAAN